MVARSASGSALQAVPEVLDELPDDARLAQDLRDSQHEIRRGCALGQRAGEAEADDLRHEHGDRLAEHRRLGLDAADAPAEHAEPVDHRRVRVGADERVRERHAGALVHDAREELEVDLMDDPGARGDDLEVVEGPLAPAQERVALAVPLELELGVPEDRSPRRELVDLHGVVDHELDREQRVDPLRVAAEGAHRVAHRGEIDHGRDAGEVLEQHARRSEGDLLRRIGARDPACDRLDVGARDVDAVLRSQHVLEQDSQRVGQPQDVVTRLEGVQAEDLVRRARDIERRSCAEAVRMGHRLRFKQLGPGKLPEPSLGERLASRVEVSCDRLRVRDADAARIGGEALVAHRLEVVRIRVEHVLAADLARGVEEGETHPDRDLEEGALLAVGLGGKALVHGGELRRRRQALGIVPQVGERPLEPLHLQRRDVDETGRGAARALERTEEVVDRRELRLLREDARVLQLGDERVEVDARASGHVRRTGEQP